jgi:hypothetical protein
MNDNMMPVENAKEAQWVIESIEKPWSRSKNANYAAAVIPCGYSAYARLFHPAYNGTEDREISWSEVARLTGRIPHSQMQWHSIASTKKSEICLANMIEPYAGYLPVKQAKALIEILSKYTSTSETCYFAIWDGWDFPDMDKIRNQTAGFQLWDRFYFLMKGDIRSAISGISSFLPPSIWWPKDRTWCIATEVDMMWTYVGGAEGCIDEILKNNSLEAWRTTPDDRADINCDKINID